MTRKKTLPSITKPFSHVHATLKTMGFTELPSREGSTYELTFRDSASLQEYPYRIYTHTQENGQTRVDLNEADRIDTDRQSDERQDGQQREGGQTAWQSDGKPPDEFAGDGKGHDAGPHAMRSPAWRNISDRLELPSEAPFLLVHLPKQGVRRE
ncbi:hypothetical protein SAMN04487970_102134 [Paenibacillus tianmuensis]|uniref:Uncharacterized protein n=1 Tax=Paenibacillus tianmuensis TaxID=624147 RepID=A0A1G4S0C7_9BACL|nr:hypothetical protein [Paenibacillus tianmuensis]SCW62145.1 hypothetical protein SAMN04487970_102134 [Paenibacillus tianmuensis]